MHIPSNKKVVCITGSVWTGSRVAPRRMLVKDGFLRPTWFTTGRPLTDAEYRHVSVAQFHLTNAEKNVLAHIEYAAVMDNGLSFHDGYHRVSSKGSSIMTPNITLMITIDVMGINTIPRSVSMRISPGKRPNQLKAEGANCSIAPTTSSTAPAIMIYFAMFSVPARYSTPSKNH